MGVVHPNGGDSVPAFGDVYFYILDRIGFSSFPIVEVSGVVYFLSGKELPDIVVLHSHRPEFLDVLFGVFHAWEYFGNGFHPGFSVPDCHAVCFPFPC